MLRAYRSGASPTDIAKLEGVTDIHNQLNKAETEERGDTKSPLEKFMWLRLVAKPPAPVPMTSEQERRLAYIVDCGNPDHYCHAITKTNAALERYEPLQALGWVTIREEGHRLRITSTEEGRKALSIRRHYRA